MIAAAITTKNVMLKPAFGKSVFATVASFLSPFTLSFFTSSCLFLSSSITNSSFFWPSSLLSLLSPAVSSFFSIVCGFGMMGKYFCEELLNVGKKFIVIDSDKEAVNSAKNLNYLAIQADATNMVTLEMMGINKGANSVVALTNDDAINLSIVLSARALNEKIKIISRVNNSNSKKKFEIAGVNKTILFNDVTAFVASQYLGQPVAFEAIDGILLNRDFDVVIDEVEIVGNSKILDKNINLINFNNYSLTLLGIINLNNLNEFIFNPINIDYKVQRNDILVIIGFKSSISQLKSDLINLNFKV